MIDNALQYKIFNKANNFACRIDDQKFITQSAQDLNPTLGWRVIKLVDGTYEIKSESSDGFWRGLSFTQSGQKVTVDHWAFTSNVNQRWQIIDLKDKKYPDLCIICDYYTKMALTSPKDINTEVTFSKYDPDDIPDTQKWRMVAF